MNTLKRIMTSILVVCLVFCAVGCAETDETYDNFKPAGVLIVDCISGDQHETNIENADYAQQMLDAFEELTIDTNTAGEMGTAYLYMRFYDESQTTFLIFTIYDNGSCCLGEEFYDFYTVVNGRQAYVDLCELYESFGIEYE